MIFLIRAYFDTTDEEYENLLKRHKSLVGWNNTHNINTTPFVELIILCIYSRRAVTKFPGGAQSHRRRDWVSPGYP